MLITLQSYNWLIPKNCENRHFDVEAEAFSTYPISHGWERECCSILFHFFQGWNKWNKWNKWNRWNKTELRV